MAQVDCVQNLDPETLDESDGCPASKRMKQARLPFKTIDHKSQIISPKSTASKKRKLSDAESPSAKAAKTPKSSTCTEKTQITSNETEVSSSSEADNVKIRVRNTLERFVRKSSQEEITSSTNNDCIDLTDTDEGKESDQSFVDLNTCQSKNIKEFFSVLSKDTSKNSDAERIENYIKVIEEVSKGNISSENSEKQEESTEQADDSNNLRENKENMDVSVDSTNSSDLNTSAIDPVTPGKGTVSPAVFKTPVSSTKSPQSLTPTSQSPGDSLSDGTPKSGKKPRSKLSEAKLKEREATRQKIKEEKLKVLEEKKKQKEQERVEKEKEKEKQRHEREAMKAEKEKQKKEEKEKKEKERLDKLQQKEEEQKKKREELEAKMEEKKKKDEEKKMKEEEKQKENEEKMKKEQKIKQAFQSFFIKPSTSPTSKVVKEPSGLFMPFQVKENTRLAPEHRESLTDEKAKNLDILMDDQSCDKLYITELKERQRVGKSEKTFPKILGDDDVELMVHDSEVVKKVTYKCKLLQFHMNYRPPYYGTWRKKSCNIRPRNPFKTDTELFDYEYDSDDDWEEEEPGESLSDCEDDDEKDEEVKEEEDGWMVPHGYLSEDEGVDEDEEVVTPEVIEMRRKSKAEQWESELNRQTKAVLPKIIGCVWEQATQVLQEEIKKQLEDYRAVLLTSDPVPTSFSEPVKSNKVDGNTTDNVDTPKVNLQKKPVPEEAMPDLIRLVHGNLMGIKRLIREFRIFWKSKMTGEQVPTSIADMSMEVDDTDNKVADTSLCQESSHNKSVNLETETDVTDCAISKRQLEIKINAIAVREKRQDYKKICWYVNNDVLKQYNCEGLSIPSAWESVIQSTKTPAKPKPEDSQNMTPGRKTPVPSIAQFARPMSPSTIAAQHAAARAKILAAAQAEKKKEPEVNQCEKMETSDVAQDSVTPQKESKKVPADQRRLTDFTKAFTSPKCQKPLVTKLSNLAASVESSSEVPDTTTITTIPTASNTENCANKLSVENQSNKHTELQSSKVMSVNGLIKDCTGENSQDAIVLD